MTLPDKEGLRNKVQYPHKKLIFIPVPLLKASIVANSLDGRSSESIQIPPSVLDYMLET